MLTVRLLRWYRRTGNAVVLLFSFNTAGLAFFAGLHALPDFLAKPVPRIIPDILAVSFMVAQWPAFLAVVVMQRASYGRNWWRYSAPLLLTIVMIDVLFSALRLGLVLDPNLRTILNFGLILSGPAWLVSYYLLVPALPNPTAKDYYKTMGYAVALYGIALCGMGLGLPLAFPLSGFPSLSMLLVGASLSFAGFASCAAYFSISEDLRRQIRQASGFLASIGEAESAILTEQQVTQFYDRFTGMAKASGAVEEAAISREEIYSYASALKRIQTAETQRRV